MFQNQDLEGNVRLDDPNDVPNINAAPAQKFIIAQSYNTLDEPVCETIKRDLIRIWEKLRVVINPIRTCKRSNGPENRSKEIKNWDLWGPFIFCLSLAVILSYGTHADDKTLLFEIVFVIVWVGAAVISINGSLLGG